MNMAKLDEIMGLIQIHGGVPPDEVLLSRVEFEEYRTSLYDTPSEDCQVLTYAGSVLLRRVPDLPFPWFLIYHKKWTPETELTKEVAFSVGVPPEEINRKEPS